MAWVAETAGPPLSLSLSLSLSVSRIIPSSHPRPPFLSANGRGAQSNGTGQSVSSHSLTPCQESEQINCNKARPTSRKAEYASPFSQGPGTAAPYRIVSLPSFSQLTVRWSPPRQAARLYHLSCPWPSQRLESGFAPIPVLLQRSQLRKMAAILRSATMRS